MDERVSQQLSYIFQLDIRKKYKGSENTTLFKCKKRDITVSEY